MTNKPDTVTVVTYQGREVLQVGKHLFAVCDDCRGLVKATGLWKGVHLCR